MAGWPANRCQPPHVQGRRVHGERPGVPPLRAGQGDAQHRPRCRARCRDLRLLRRAGRLGVRSQQERAGRAGSLKEAMDILCARGRHEQPALLRPVQRAGDRTRRLLAERLGVNCCWCRRGLERCCQVEAGHQPRDPEGHHGSDLSDVERSQFPDVCSECPAHEYPCSG